MFIRIRHGINEEMVVNPACFVVSFFRYIRRNIDVDAVDFDAVALCSEEPIVCVEKRLELATESGLVQGLDDLTLNDSAGQQLCHESGLALNRNGETGKHYVLLEKRLLSLSTNEVQLTAIKKALESDGRRLYERNFSGVVSVTKTSSGRGRRGSVISGSSSPTNSLKSSTINRPSSSNMRVVDSGSFQSTFVQEKSGNTIVERFYYHPLMVDIQSALPDFVIHRTDDKSIGVPIRPKLPHRGLSNRSSGMDAK